MDADPSPANAIALGYDAAGVVPESVRRKPVVRPAPAALGQRVVALAGPVGANKRAMTEALANVLQGSTIVKYVQYLQAIAKQLQVLQPSYKDLQDIGLQVIMERGWLGYSFETLRRAELDKSTILVDGLRHAMAVNVLRRMQRVDEVSIIYVDATAEEQRANLLERNVPEGEIDAVLSHPVEAESHIVRYLADRVVRSEAEGRIVAADLHSIFQESLILDRDEMYRQRIVSTDILDELLQQPQRFEALREIFRLVGRSLGDYNPLKVWLNSPIELDLETRNPLKVIREGDPASAVQFAIDFVLRVVTARFPNQKLMTFWGASPDDPEAVRRARLVDQSERVFLAQGVTLDEFGRNLKGHYLAGKISLEQWSRFALEHYGPSEKEPEDAVSVGAPT